MTAILYGDSSQATIEAIEMLEGAKIPYHLCLTHDASTAPSVDALSGVYKGLRSIAEFAGAPEPKSSLDLSDRLFRNN